MDLAKFDAFVNRPELHDYLAILKGARNGLVYGAKIRFPHALVMTTLFHKGDLRSKILFIFKATKQHAFNLASFCSLYKAIMLLQSKINGGKERTGDPFFSGLIAGYVVFGDRNAVNEQIVLYVTSRVVASFLPRLSTPPTYSVNSPPPRSFKPIPPAPIPFGVFAAFAWAAVMLIFRRRPETLQGGLSSSMQYLYRDSDYWSNFRTLLWHNK